MPDAEREAELRKHVAHVAIMCGKEAEMVQGHVTFLLRLLDEARAEIARLTKFNEQLGKVQAGLRQRATQAIFGWRPIETAPKDGAWILSWGKTDEPGRAFMVVAWSTRDREWYSPTEDGLIDITHWMPLPAPPETELPQEKG